MLMDCFQILQPLPAPAQQSLLSSLARRSGDLDVLANNSCENDLGSQDTICKFNSCLFFFEMRVEIRNLSNPSLTRHARNSNLKGQVSFWRSPTASEPNARRKCDRHSCRWENPGGCLKVSTIFFSMPWEFTFLCFCLWYI